MPAIEEQRAALLGVAERGVAALVLQVVGLGLDDPCRQPQVSDPVADDLAEQRLGDGLRIAVEEGVGQGTAGGPGGGGRQTKVGIGEHGLSGRFGKA
ncbi:hypothetical protein D9M69_392610 [compost metagenome]